MLKKPIDGFSWMLILGEEVFIFSGLVMLSWLASSSSLYALEASFFLIVVGLLQVLFASLIFHWNVHPLRSFRSSLVLFPTWNKLVGMVAVAHFVAALLALILTVVLNVVNSRWVPVYWWLIGPRFVFVSEDVCLLYPMALRIMAGNVGEKPAQMRWFLIGWMIFLAGWLIGGVLDFEENISPPRMILLCECVSVLIFVPGYYIAFYKPFRKADA